MYIYNFLFTGTLQMIGPITCLSFSLISWSSSNW